MSKNPDFSLEEKKIGEAVSSKKALKDANPLRAKPKMESLNFESSEERESFLKKYQLSKVEIKKALAYCPASLQIWDKYMVVLRTTKSKSHFKLYLQKLKERNEDIREVIDTQDAMV